MPGEAGAEAAPDEAEADEPEEDAEPEEVAEPEEDSEPEEDDDPGKEAANVSAPTERAGELSVDGARGRTDTSTTEGSRRRAGERPQTSLLACAAGWRPRTATTGDAPEAGAAATS